MRLGAFDYITKPFDLDEIKQVAKNAIERRQLDSPKQGQRIKKAISQTSSNMVGSSPAMMDIINMVDRVKDSRASVLIRGESGTGKELVAKALHYSSIRVDKPFIAVACVALPEQLLQSELFGHEKGSFTSAISQKKGRFELANHGTLFLDEIGDIPHTVQMMLLRVIQEREFERVGGTETIKTDVRLVTATNQNLERLVDEGKFREDLFYRLQVITLMVPPLRERPDDIKTLAEHFIEKYSQENGKKITGLSKAAVSVMQKYRWPGNVRELENAMERAVVLADPNEVSISPDLLPTCVTAKP
jgi:DNA-binding NtrC family response regulator